MKEYLEDAIYSKFSIGWKELYYEESEKRRYMQFTANNELYIATMIKGGSQVTIYKLDKAVTIYED